MKYFQNHGKWKAVEGNAELVVNHFAADRLKIERIRLKARLKKMTLKNKKADLIREEQR